MPAAKGQAAESYEEEAGGVDQQSVLLAYHLHQEGTLGNGRYALSSVLYTAVGTLGNSSQGTYAGEGQGTETSAYQPVEKAS